jgi:hypothetical protein
MTDTDDTTGGEATGRAPYLSDRERAGIARWAAILADRPPMTAEQITNIGAILRRIDARRNTE